MNALISRLETSGFERVPTVRDVGEFAVRGGILDLYAPGSGRSACGSISSAIRWRRSAPSMSPPSAPPASARRSSLQAMTEVTLTPETISRFRRNYIEAFGAPSRDDALYAAISEGRRFAGMEHWLPFYLRAARHACSTICPTRRVIFDHLAREAIDERHTLILDYYEARRQQAGSALKDAVPYKPMPPDLIYLSPDDVARGAARPRGDRVLALRRARRRADASVPRRFAQRPQLRRGARRPVNANVFDAAVKHIAAVRAAKRRVVVAGWTEGSLDRLARFWPSTISAICKRSRNAGRARKARRRARRASPCCRSKPASRPTASPSSPSRTFWATGWCAARRSARRHPISSPRRRRCRPATSSCTPTTASAASSA